MDCRPDLALETVSEDGKNRILELYYYRDDGFCFVNQNQFPGNEAAFKYSSISYSDIGVRGANDIFFLADHNFGTGQNEIRAHILLNKKTLPKTGEVLCVKEEGSESSPSASPFESFDKINIKGAQYTKVNFSKLKFL